MLLSQDDIRELTGYKKAASQIQWLRQNGIKHLIGCDGKPRVLLSQIESIIGSNTKNTKRRVEPDEQGLDQFMGII
jgi:hypothetical protein